MKIYLVCCFSLCCFFQHLFAKPTFRLGKDYALFFANDDYRQNTDFGDLKNPLKDAHALAKELKDMFAFETHVYPNYTKMQIYQKLEEWQAKVFKEDAQLFIFFSGHGTFWDFANNGYFVPKGRNTDYESYIELKTLGNIVTKFGCKNMLLAIDACYSGTIDNEIAFKGQTFNRPGAQAFEKERLIQNQLRHKSRLLITSGGKQRTPDGDHHSPFSWAIIKGLRHAYSSGDGLITFRDLLAQLERVRPLPHQGELIGHEGGGFVFISKDMPPKQPNSSLTLGKGSFSDRDGNTYTYQTMADGKVWMTQNLNVEVPDSYCFDKLPSNCDKYGRLYTYEAAKKGCKTLGADWRLPTDQEWREMAKQYGGVNDDADDLGYAAYKALIEKGSSGFDALLGGGRDTDGSFLYIVALGYYWSATATDGGNAYGYDFDGVYERLDRYYYGQSNGFSVRCLQD